MCWAPEPANMTDVEIKKPGLFEVTPISFPVFISQKPGLRECSCLWGPRQERSTGKGQTSSPILTQEPETSVPGICSGAGGPRWGHINSVYGSFSNQ